MVRRGLSKVSLRGAVFATKQSIHIREIASARFGSPRNDTTVLSLCFICCIIFFQGCSSKVSESQVHFQKANEFYKKGGFDQAIKEYEEILLKKVATPALYYNLGNCYFKMSQLGKAMVNYERAFRLAPRDGDIKANLNYALSFVKNYQQPTHLDWSDRVFIHIHQVSVNELLLILTGLFVIAGGVFIIGLFVTGLNNRIRFVLMILGIVFIFHYAALLKKIESQNDEAIVLVNGPARFEPEDKATVHYEMSEGWKVKIIKESDGWQKVMRWDGKQGWVPRYNLGKI